MVVGPAGAPPVPCEGYSAMNPWRSLMVLIVACVVWAAPAAAAEKTPPEQAAKFMEGLSGEALAILGAQGSSLDKREADLRALLSRSFDFQKISRFVLGRAWRTATPEQRDEYQRLFQEFVLRTYSRRLGGYSGQVFKITKAEPMGKIDAVVVTEIGRPSGPPMKAGWRVRGGAGAYKILDVIVEGVSMLATQRSEFASVVRSQGVDGLIEVLRVQVNKFAARAS